MIYRGPLQPEPFCDFVILPKATEKCSYLKSEVWSGRCGVLDPADCQSMSRSRMRCRDVVFLLSLQLFS